METLGNQSSRRQNPFGLPRFPYWILSRANYQAKGRTGSCISGTEDEQVSEVSVKVVDSKGGRAR